MTDVISEEEMELLCLCHPMKFFETAFVDLVDSTLEEQLESAMLKWIEAAWPDWAQDAAGDVLNAETLIRDEEEAAALAPFINGLPASVREGAVDCIRQSIIDLADADDSVANAIAITDRILSALRSPPS